MRKTLFKIISNNGGSGTVNEDQWRTSKKLKGLEKLSLKRACVSWDSQETRMDRGVISVCKSLMAGNEV